MKYSAIDVAKYIVSTCNNDNKPISNLKLQKMLYYIWIDFFKEKKSELFLDEIYAWPLGPVIPEVYNEFCVYAGSPIRKNYLDINILEEDSLLLNKSIEKYIDKSPSYLVNKTHKKGKPWDVVFKGGKGNRAVIPFSLIKELECNS